ncbi:hypothetical protein, partial [Enterococcus faecium]|uniref:hypothetical protein n=1 Tax=Enterococcus faecium TaxID=1352 RepID=UPI0030C848A2
AGTYRVYADFTATGGTPVTLSRTVDIAGVFQPRPPTGTERRVAVDGFDVSITGDLVAGAASELTVEVSRDGVPVTTLEPYLGPYGQDATLHEGGSASLRDTAHVSERAPERDDRPHAVTNAP